MSEIKWLLKEWDKLCPVKCYTWNFTRRKIWVLFANKWLVGFLIKYLPPDFLQDCWVNKDWFIYFNFVNPSRNDKTNKRRIYSK